MDNEEIERAIQKIYQIEKKMEKYYEMLKLENELDFILKGGYVLKDELQPSDKGKLDVSLSVQNNKTYFTPDYLM